MIYRRVIIAGSRSFNDFDLLEKKLRYLEDQKVEVVSGNARGADRLGEKWAALNDKNMRLFPADWEKHGKAAGFIRNRQMAKYADELVAFWDGKSKGTKHMIDAAMENGCAVRVVLTDETPRT